MWVKVWRNSGVFVGLPAVQWNHETNRTTTDFGLVCLSEKYDYVGRLLKPGEEPSEYTDEEDTKDHSKQD